MQRGKRGLNADRRFCGVNADRKIIQRDLNDIVADLGGVVRIVGQRLIVRYQDVDLIELAGVLQLHTALQRSDIMTEM